MAFQFRCYLTEIILMLILNSLTYRSDKRHFQGTTARLVKPKRVGGLQFMTPEFTQNGLEEQALEPFPQLRSIDLGAVPQTLLTNSHALIIEYWMTTNKRDVPYITINRSPTRTWTLLYRGSRDGFSCNDFH